MAITIKSPAFNEGDAIPPKYTCDAENNSPPLQWEGVPDSTRSLALIIDDPDAPDPNAPKMTWVHWVLYNLPPDTTGLDEAMTSATLPAGTLVGINDWKQLAYGGPCPPIGRHRYFHKLYALDTMLEGLNKPTKKQLEAAMKGHVLASVELVATYQKSGR